jgi:hypothetical protein
MATGRKHIDNYFTAGGVAAALNRGADLQTHVEDESGAAVYLTPGDEICSECDDLIPSDAFGRAPYGRVLGHMKRAVGTTYCGECYPPAPETND